MILPDQIDNVLTALTDQHRLYFIPSFQRPYAWEKKQIEDLRNDMKKAHNNNSPHYLASLHFLSYDPNDAEHPLGNFAEHAMNIVQAGMQNGQLRTLAGPVSLYAVVDGQQRLITLFLLAHIVYQHFHQHNPIYNRGVFEIHTLNGISLPRVILGSPNDHDFLMNIVAHVWDPALPLPQHQNQAQVRMRHAFDMMNDWVNQPQNGIAPPQPWVNFLTNENFRVLRVLLNSDDGLNAFMTLNDRGRDLTILEKLKALLLQYVYDASRIHVPDAYPLITQLHTIFGQLYQVIDRCILVELFSGSKADDDAVKLISCYIRLDVDHRAIWQGPDQAYEEYFRYQLEQAQLQDIPGIVQPWSQKIQELTDQLSNLVSCIQGAQLCNATPSLNFGGFQLSDDYHAILISLGLQPHLLALLLRFRAKFNTDWHQRFPVPVGAFSRAPIVTLLNDIRARANIIQPPPMGILNYIDELLEAKVAPRNEISMIEIVERMQLVNWNLGHKLHAGFQVACLAMNNLQNAGDCIQLWRNWCSCDGFIANILYSYNGVNFGYLLKEMERDRTNIHNLHRKSFPPQISQNDITLEHIFAQNIDGAGNQGFAGFQTYGIIDRVEYEQQVLWRSGNFTWLSVSGNTYLGNKNPEIKAAHYANCAGHAPGGGGNVCSDIAITHEVGTKMITLGLHLPSFRFFIEARCAELALFAVKRFC